jgi:hypothetical protein
MNPKVWCCVSFKPTPPENSRNIFSGFDRAGVIEATQPNKIDGQIIKSADIFVFPKGYASRGYTRDKLSKLEQRILDDVEESNDAGKARVALDKIDLCHQADITGYEDILALVEDRVTFEELLKDQAEMAEARRKQCEQQQQREEKRSGNPTVALELPGERFRNCHPSLYSPLPLPPPLPLPRCLPFSRPSHLPCMLYPAAFLYCFGVCSSRSLLSAGPLSSTLLARLLRSSAHMFQTLLCVLWFLELKSSLLSQGARHADCDFLYRNH